MAIREPSVPMYSVLYGPSSLATLANASLCCFARARISSNSPIHWSESGKPPGVPCIAGVVPAGNCSRNHAGLSRMSMTYVSNGTPASASRSPSLWQ